MKEATATLDRKAPELTVRQIAALDELVAAFNVEHSKRFEVVLKVYRREWTEVDINPNHHIVRKSEKRCKIAS